MASFKVHCWKYKSGTFSKILEFDSLNFLNVYERKIYSSITNAWAIISALVLNLGFVPKNKYCLISVSNNGRFIHEGLSNLNRCTTLRHNLSLHYLVLGPWKLHSLGVPIYSSERGEQFYWRLIQAAQILISKGNWNPIRQDSADDWR